MGSKRKISAVSQLHFLRLVYRAALFVVLLITYIRFMLFSEADLQVLKDVLSLDPRPHYHDDDQREYGMPFMGCDVRFRIADGVLHVTSIEC